MMNSIHYFQTKVVKNLEKIFLEYSSDMTKIAEMVSGVTDCMMELGVSMIAEELENYDEYLRQNRQCRPLWHIVRRDRTSLLTSLGTVTYHKTLFRNKETGAYEYLLDRVMGMEPHARMTEDVEARILEEAVQTSYRKGGEQASISADMVSRETVKNKIHSLKFPKKKDYPEKKKEVEYLYIDADEDHVALQFREKKGDLVENEYHQKNNGAISKLVYVYEGIEKAAPESRRHELVSPYYFCRVCGGEENRELWDEVYEYLENTYDLNKVKKIYLNADGGSWIKSGMRRIAGIVYVLDEFHLKKYLQKIVGHRRGEAGEKLEELIRIIRNKTKKEFEEAAGKLKKKVTSPGRLSRMEEGIQYILSNWTAAKLRLRHKEGVRGSSTESHVSHVLSSRMSTRPMGWSKKGMGKMAELRAYYYNGGDMLELVRYQRGDIPAAVGCEEVVYSSSKVLASERKYRKELGNLANLPVYSIPYTQIKKMANLKHQIYGL